MAIITDYTTLDQAVDDYLHRSDLSSWVPNFIQNCESKLYKRVMIRDMEKTFDIAVSSGLGTVPTDYRAMKFAYRNANPTTPLQIVTLEELYEEYPGRSDGGIPAVFTREAGNFIFGPGNPADFTMKGVYYYTYTLLSAGVKTTNWYTDNAPECLLYGSLVEAAPFIGDDERLPLWQSMFEEAVRIVEHEQKRENLSGGTKRQRTRASGSTA